MPTADPTTAWCAVDTIAFRGRMRIEVDGPGDGPAIVLVHGFVSSLRWFDAVTALLADTFRVVRVDLVGHGSTGGPALDAPAQTAVVEQVLESLDLHDAVAVGHSFGADVAVGLAGATGRVTKVAIVAQAPDYSDAVLPFGHQVMIPRRVSAVLHRAAVPAVVTFGALVSRTRLPNHEFARQAAADFAAVHPGMFGVVIRDRRERLRERPLDAQLREAGKPALVILGGKDHFYGARSAPRYRDAGAQVEILADSGHSPITDYPRETAARLRRFATD